MVRRPATCASAIRSCRSRSGRSPRERRPGSTVTVVFPKGFEVEVEAGKIAAPTTEDDGRTIFRSGKLAKPLEFFAYLVADRPGRVPRRHGQRPRSWALRSRSTSGPGRTTSRWAKRVSGLLTQGLPRSATRIGLDWPDYDAAARPSRRP